VRDDEIKVQDFGVLGAFVLALIVIGMLLMPNAGCSDSQTLRASIGTATQVLESAHKVTYGHCQRLAKVECKTDPCPALETCKKVHKYLLDAAVAGAGAAKYGYEMFRVMEENDAD
jgi:membrane-bound ClpP family serine protease